ncbi:hypothetical protein VOLCADRAFT_96783 [Volvox carteri f. nagariensis]|uniref:Uncharacterized protein n=1 Tax=Volvox carteri f. nagariensis TaxID=3068 RepID=D8UB17_VOLCA|nr:uncharacterized protein VOLCADRAFT_96783 [Volvox carteri f. nagariensis]EFJ43091.1 hypothetical protein VOLCADRAFT_96783 [Volvox carteri f. nagariensis]|eukprot:XP_002955890.1 hypothetical protein VOLCADRAFT_96783 [Volvox carteri f. nagariensis]
MAPIMDIFSVGFFQRSGCCRGPAAGWDCELGFGGEVVYGVAALMCSVWLAHQFAWAVDVDFKLPYVVVRQLASTAVLLIIEWFIRPLYNKYGVQFVWMLLLGHHPHVYTPRDALPPPPRQRRRRRKDDETRADMKAAAANGFPSFSTAAAAPAVAAPSTGGTVSVRQRQAAAATAAALPPLTSRSGSTATTNCQGAGSGAVRGLSGCEHSAAVTAAAATTAASYGSGSGSTQGRTITVISAAPTASVAAPMAMTSPLASAVSSSLDNGGDGGGFGAGQLPQEAPGACATADADPGPVPPPQQHSGPVLLQPATAAVSPNAERQICRTVDAEVAPAEPRPAAGSDRLSNLAKPESYMAFHRTTVAAAAGGCSAAAAQLLGTTATLAAPAAFTGTTLAAAAAARPLRGYVGRTRLLSTTVKIRGVHLADVPAGYQQRIAAVLAAADLELEGVYLRAGCIELVVDARSWNARPGGDAAAAAGAGDVSRRTQRSGWAEIHVPGRAESGAHPPPQGQHGPGGGGGGGQQAALAVEASGGGDDNNGSGSNPHHVKLLSAAALAAAPPPPPVPQMYDSGNGAAGGGYGLGGGKAVDVGELIRALHLRQDGLSVEHSGSLTDLCRESDDVLTRNGGGAAAAAAAPPPPTWEANGSDSITMDPSAPVVQGMNAATAVAAVPLPPQLLSVSPRVLQTRSAAAAAAAAASSATTIVELVLLVACPGDRVPELLVRSHGAFIPGTVTSCVSVGAPAGVSLPLRDVLMCTVALPLAALPDEPGVLMVEVRWAGETHGSALPLLLADDAALAAELQAAVEDWRGPPLELEDLLLDFACFLLHTNCMLRPTAGGALAAYDVYDSFIYEGASAPFAVMRDRVSELGLHMLAWMDSCLSGWGCAMRRLQTSLAALGVSSAAIEEVRRAAQQRVYQHQHQYQYQPQQLADQQHFPQLPHRGQSYGDYYELVNQEQQRRGGGGGGGGPVPSPHDDELYDDVRCADNRKAAGLAARQVFTAAAAAAVGGGGGVRHAVHDMPAATPGASAPLGYMPGTLTLQQSHQREERQTRSLAGTSSTISQLPAGGAAPASAASGPTAAASYGPVAVTAAAAAGQVHPAGLGTISSVSPAASSRSPSPSSSASSSSSYVSTCSTASLAHVVPAGQYEASTATTATATTATATTATATGTDMITPTTTVAAVATVTCTATATAAQTLTSTFSKSPSKCGGVGRNDPRVASNKWFTKSKKKKKQQLPEPEQQPAPLSSFLQLISDAARGEAAAAAAARCRCGSAVGFRRRVTWAVRAVQEDTAAAGVKGVLRVALDWGRAVRSEYSCLVAAGYRAFVVEYTAQMVYAINIFTTIWFLILALPQLLMSSLAGCLIAWGGVPAAAGFRSYQLSAAAFIVDGIVHIAASMVRPTPALLVALVRMPVHMATWTKLGGTFGFRWAVVRAAALACLSVTASVGCHAYLLVGVYRRRYGNAAAAAAAAAANVAASTAAAPPPPVAASRELRPKRE